MTHSEFEALAAAYSLDALDDAEKQQFESYLNNASEEEKQIIADFDRVATLLGIAAKPVAPRPQVKDRLLDVIKHKSTAASDSQRIGYVTIFADDGHWQLQAEGVRAKILYQDPDTQASTTLLRMEAGSQLEGHSHAMMEEIYMLEGECHSAGKLLKAGDYHRAEAGSAHAVTTTRQGCLMLVISRVI